MRVAIIAACLFAGMVFAPPSPPVAVWTAPGQLTITYEGGVLWYQRPGSPAVFLPCDSPCVLKTGGDALYSPQAGASAWVQNAEGGTSTIALVPPEPKWYSITLPLVYGATTE